MEWWLLIGAIVCEVAATLALRAATDHPGPFGGVKQSGLGREGGDEGIEEYLSTTYVALAL